MNLVNLPIIIFIYSDDQRQDVMGFDGNEIIISPERDRFAKMGIQFTSANVVIALCTPAWQLCLPADAEVLTEYFIATAI